MPETFAAHAKLMFDLQVLAFQTDMTRVITFMLGREFGSRNYREIGIPEGHHTVTHHQNKQVQIDEVIQDPFVPGTDVRVLHRSAEVHARR